MFREDEFPAPGRARMKALRSAATRLGRQQSLVVLASFVTSLVALTALVPILVRALGTKTYGAWVLTGGIVNYITLLDFGMSLTIARFVALEYKRNRRGAEQAIGVGLGVVTLVGLLAVAVTFPLAGSWQGYPDVSGSAFATEPLASYSESTGCVPYPFPPLYRVRLCRSGAGR